MANKTLGKIIVKKAEGDHFNLHFSSREAFDEALFQLKKNGIEIVDEFWGYSLYDDAEDALYDVTCYFR